jgi:hypothetical protein
LQQYLPLPDSCIAAKNRMDYCSGRDVHFIARPPHRSVHAAFPHTACMGLSLSRAHHAVFVVLLLHSFVRPALRAFFRPDRILPSPSRAATVKDDAS